ncbi:MAG: FAD-dependent oxidoreductase [Bryobacteraceae bacterium]|nr:FAD-dependent oxidoreductase [Bryobacteraceae bacterium]
MDERSCLIVGGGIAGLTAAETLQEAGWKVTVVEKGRGPGGRLSTRRIGESKLDHGAQFLTVRDDLFQKRITKWESAGVVRPWFTSDDGHTRYCGVDGMNGIAKDLARGLNVQSHSHVVHVEHCDGRWLVQDEQGNTYDAPVLVLTPPAEQSLALCEPFRPLLGRKLVQTLQSIHFEPCYALMITGDGKSRVPEPGYVRPASGAVQWVGDNVRKGITAGPLALTIHATARFTTDNWEKKPDAITAMLLEEVALYIDGSVQETELHRWRYSKPVRTETVRCLHGTCPGPIYFAGDAFGGPRVEGAFLSGLETAKAILASSGQTGHD